MKLLVHIAILAFLVAVCAPHVVSQSEKANLKVDPFGTATSTTQENVQAWFDANGGSASIDRTDPDKTVSDLPNISGKPAGDIYLWLGATKWYTSTSGWGAMTEMSKGPINSRIAVIARQGGCLFENSPFTYTQNTVIQETKPSKCTLATSFTISEALPTGITFNTATAGISGTASTLAAAKEYTVTPNTGPRFKFTLSVVLTVHGCKYASSPHRLTVDVVAPNTVVPTGCSSTPTSFTLSGVPSLHAGLSFSSSTGAFTGTPTSLTAQPSVYTVTPNNSAGPGTAFEVSLDVTPPPPTSCSAGSATDLVWTKNAAIPSNLQNQVQSCANTPTEFTISPNAPAGVTINSGTGILSGTPTAVVPKTEFTITPKNRGGDGNLIKFYITVDPLPVDQCVYAGSPLTAYLVDTKMDLSPTQCVNEPTSFAITPTLPAGLTMSTVTGKLTGTPTGVVDLTGTEYTVTPKNQKGDGTLAKFTLMVKYPKAVCSFPAVKTNFYMVASKTVVPTCNMITNVTMSQTLPAGLMLTATSGAVSGTATAISSETTFYFTPSNLGGMGQSFSLAITVGESKPFGLKFNTNPAGGASKYLEVLGTQPVVQVTDEWGNGLTTVAASTITLGIDPTMTQLVVPASGATATPDNGFVTAETKDGIATFSGVKLDRPGNKIVAVATGMVASSKLKTAQSGMFSVKSRGAKGIKALSIPLVEVKNEKSQSPILIGVVDENGYPDWESTAKVTLVVKTVSSSALREKLARAISSLVDYHVLAGVTLIEAAVDGVANFTGKVTAPDSLNGFTLQASTAEVPGAAAVSTTVITVATASERSALLEKMLAKPPAAQDSSLVIIIAAAGGGFVVCLALAYYFLTKKNGLGSGKVAPSEDPAAGVVRQKTKKKKSHKDKDGKDGKDGKVDTGGVAAADGTSKDDLGPLSDVKVEAVGPDERPAVPNEEPAVPGAVGLSRKPTITKKKK